MPESDKNESSSRNAVCGLVLAEATPPRIYPLVELQVSRPKAGRVSVVNMLLVGGIFSVHVPPPRPSGDSAQTDSFDPTS